MSRLFAALLERTCVPSREALQAAIKTLKFDLIVDDGYQPFETSGYLPCTIKGEDGGMNMSFADAEDHLTKFPALRTAAETRNILITLRWGGDPREEVCARMLAATLAQSFQAVVHDPKKDTVMAAEDLIKQARAQFAELD